MKPATRIVLGIFACILLSAGAYFWATGLLDSTFAYRSPLRYGPPVAGQSLGNAITRRIIFVLIDGLREDTSKKADVMPFLAELRQQGASATMRSRAPSYSQMAYTALLTGAWPDLSDGPVINLDYSEIPVLTQDNLFLAIQRKSGKAAISGYYWFEKLVPQAAVSESFYTPGEDRTADQDVVAAALPWLDDPSLQLVLIHLDQVDYAGHHEGGAKDPRWDQAAARTDELARQIAARLDLSKDTIFICSDHGHLSQGGHGGQDPIVLTEPFILAGAGVRPGKYPDVQMADVAPSLAAMLGVNIPASSQGHVLTSMLSFDPGQLAGINTALNVQQEQLVQVYEKDTGKKVLLANDPDPVNAHQIGLEQAIAGPALSGERIIRGMIALLGVGMLVFVFYRLRGRALAWMLGTAGLYILLFNLRYLLIDGNSYSLSSIQSPEDIILYSTVTTLAAAFLSAAVFWIGCRDSFRSPSQAAQVLLSWTLVVLVVLSLPALWHFTLNGPLVTTRLPDLASTFAAFLFLLQMVLVGLFGPLLAGAAALVVAVRQKDSAVK